MIKRFAIFWLAKNDSQLPDKLAVDITKSHFFSLLLITYLTQRKYDIHFNNNKLWSL